MGLQPQSMSDSEGIRAEVSALRSFGVRWAILAAWRDDLVRRGVGLKPGLARQLEFARTKVASGCFSSCEVGCDLTAIERDLGAVETSSADDALVFWVELLGRAMTSADEVEQLLRIPVVKAHFINCGSACRCQQ